LPQYIYTLASIVLSSQKYEVHYFIHTVASAYLRTENQKYTVKKTRDRMQICECSGKYQLID